MKSPLRYLLINGKLYATSGPGIEPGNLYPVAFGRFMGTAGDLPGNVTTAAHGDTVTLFGSRYEVNVLPTDGTCEDEIDLELVHLTRRDDPEGAIDVCPACGLELDARGRCPDGPLCGVDAKCGACGRYLEDTPSGPRCPDMSYHTADDWGL
jgi:hypothetical protein